MLPPLLQQPYWNEWVCCVFFFFSFNAIVCLNNSVSLFVYVWEVSKYGLVWLLTSHPKRLFRTLSMCALQKTLSMTRPLIFQMKTLYPLQSIAYSPPFIAWDLWSAKTWVMRSCSAYSGRNSPRGRALIECRPSRVAAPLRHVPALSTCLHTQGLAELCSWLSLMNPFVSLADQWWISTAERQVMPCLVRADVQPYTVKNPRQKRF